jgi:small subunit ribosomal protein S20e
MSFQKPEKDFGEGPKVHKIRITLTSRKVQSLEKVCTELLERAKSKNLRVKGPVRLPTKVLKVRKNRKTQKSAAHLVSSSAQRENKREKQNTDEMINRSPPARPPAVRVPRPGTCSRCASTSA